MPVGEHLLETRDIRSAGLKLGADRRMAAGQARTEDVNAPRVEGRDAQAARQLFRHGDDDTGRIVRG